MNYRTEPQRILIVDDEVLALWGLEGSVGRLFNGEIVTATSGQAALQAFEQQSFDLLITDYQMPDMDGLALGERIQQMYPQTAVAVVTSSSIEQLRRKAVGFSIRHILEKPLLLTEIRRMISDLWPQQEPCPVA
jgi:CheY-like chemotaxis protein